uniref:Aminoglycoside phosphotransferase domain-containing protein n=1 Tax=Moniliophthora roreri TaxID=221103 RepID=A0A0W0G7N0_MONRR
MAQSIQICVHGSPGSGKSMLAAHLHGRIHRRHRSHYHLNVVDASQDVDPDLLLLVYNTISTTHSSFLDILKKLIVLSLPIIIVGTKTDILAQEEPNNYMKTRQAFAWGYDMIYVPVDNISGEGIDELVRRIVDIVSAPAPAQLDIVRCIKQNIEKLVALVLDGIAWCFKLPPPEPIVKHNLDLNSLADDAEISNLVSQPTAQEWDRQLSQRLNTEPSFIAPISAHLITPSLIAKRPSPSEVAAMEYVRQNTSIPTPRVHLSTESWLVMDHIDGAMLYECWNRLSLFMRFRVICTLRLYVKQLHSLKVPDDMDRAGALEDGVLRGVVCAIDEKELRPGSGRRLRQLCEFAFLVGRGETRTLDVHFPFDDCEMDWSLVFNHGDLNPSNIMLAKDSSLWLIDWGFAGFYPAFFETIAMKVVDELLYDVNPESWSWYRWFTAGEVKKSQWRAWVFVRSGLYRF